MQYPQGIENESKVKLIYGLIPIMVKVPNKSDNSLKAFTIHGDHSKFDLSME